jgi:hypothetical protein
LRDWNGAVIAGPPIINQNYTSKNNLMVVAARFSYTDWFDCRWTTVPTPPVTQPEKPVTQGNMTTENIFKNCSYNDSVVFFYSLSS